MVGSGPTTPTAAPSTCTCVPGVICDTCASMQIETANAGAVELGPGMLTPTEQAGIVSARAGVASWLGSLGGGQ